MKKDVDGNQTEGYQLRVRQPQQKMTTTYLTESQMENLMTECRKLRRGRKLQGGRKTYTVIVDGEHHYFSTTTSLSKFLSCCVVPENFRTYRNFDKGVTINLD